MLNFADYISEQKILSEKFVNLFDKSEKDKYKDEVYSLLKKAYEPVGGLIGSGFRDADDMVKSLPMWKLSRKDNKIVAGILYKDKGGRKAVATFTDGSTEGKKQLADIIKNEFTRSYSEVSDAALGFAKKQFGEDMLLKFAIPKEKVKSILKLDDNEYKADVPDTDRNVKSLPKLKDYFYQRKIGGEFHTKLMLGNATKIIRESITESELIEFLEEGLFEGE